MNEIARSPEWGATALLRPRHVERKWLRTQEAAEYLSDISGVRYSPATLITWRTRPPRGGGPRFQRFGSRVVYAREEIDRWHQERLSAPLGSTSEPAHGG